MLSGCTSAALGFSAGVGVPCSAAGALGIIGDARLDLRRQTTDLKSDGHGGPIDFARPCSAACSKFSVPTNQEGARRREGPVASLASHSLKGFIQPTKNLYV